MPHILPVQKIHSISAGGGGDSLSATWHSWDQSSIPPLSVVVLLWEAILVLTTSLASWLVHLSSDVAVSTYLFVTL